MKKIIAIALTLLVCLSVVSMAVFADTTTYYLVGYLNGADYGFEADAANMGDYKFVNGKLTVKFDQDSYVFLKTEGNAAWFMTDTYVDGTSATFKNTENGTSKEKMKVPGNVEVTFTLKENADGSIDLSYVVGGGSDNTDNTTSTTTTPTQSTTAQKPSGTRKLTIKVPSSWTNVNIYTWEPEEFGTFPGGAVTKTGSDYTTDIKNSMVNLIVSTKKADDTIQKTEDLVLKTNGKDVTVTVAEDGKATISYAGETTPPSGSGKDAAPDPVGRPTSTYRVVGDAAWMGAWKADSDLGLMYDMGGGVYRKNFDNVEPGTYQLKITKDGKWDNAYGDNGNNYTFTVVEKCKITVDFTLKGDVAVIEVYGRGVPETGDVSMVSVMILLALASVTAVVLVVNRKKFI